MSEKITNDDLDQGFNDDELADIMSEIENLEKEFVDETPATHEEEPKVEALKIDVAEVETKKTDLQAEIDNEMENLFKAQTAEAAPIVQEAPKPTAEIVEFPKAEAALNPLEEAIQAIESEKTEEDAFLSAATSVVEEVAPVEAKVPVIEETVTQVPVEEVVMDNVVALKNTRVETVETKAAPVSTNQTQLDFSVAGQMNLKLNFTIGGQTISLFVNEAEGMVIEMMGGARFTLPMGETAAKKKAA